MFSVNCPKAGTEVLLGPHAILSVHNTSRGVITYFRCHCGELGFMVSGRYGLDDVVALHTGSSTPAPRPLEVAAAS